MSEEIRNTGNADDGVQHGIDDDPHDDGKKALGLGAIGGGAVGAIAGSMLGPAGAIAGAAIGGSIGSIASGAAVDAVDAIDNDDTVTGLGSSQTQDVEDQAAGAGFAGTSTGAGFAGTTDTGGFAGSTGSTLNNGADVLPGNDVAGVQTGGTTTAGADTRGVTEKAADAITGDSMDDKTGGVTGGVAGTGFGTGSTLSDTTTDADTIRVPVVEEELNVQKQAQQTGEVQVTKQVIEEQVNVPVTVQREEVVVTRNPVDRPLQAGEDVLQDGDTIRVPVTEEVVTVSKEARVAEEIEIQKQTTAEQQVVSDTVRREEVDIADSTGRTDGTGRQV